MSFVLAGYVEVEQIGRGGIGDVYRATRASTGATVAIKVLRDVGDGSAAWRRARRELAALVSLAGHAHVVQVHEVLDLDGHPALVMEYVSGGSIGDLLSRRDGVLTAGEVAVVGAHAARALVAAHEQAIVHRDVKPQNLLVDAYGHVKLCDFGVAALARSGEFHDRTTALSMRYASPEDLEDPSDGVEVGSPSDVYSLGATLLHLARGAPPTLKDRLAPWTPPVGAGAELAAIDAVIARCLRPAPDERPTAAELLADLEQLGDHVDLPRSIGIDVEPSPVRLPALPSGQDITAATAHRPVEPPRPVPVQAGGTRAALSAVVLAVIVLAVVVLAVVVSSRSGRERPVEVSIASRAPTLVPTTVPVTAPATVAVVAWLERPAGLAPLAAAVWPFGPIGECLVQTAGEAELRQVDCAESHDLQRFAAGELASGSPEDGSFDAAVGRACEAHLRALVDPEAVPSGVELASTRPSPASWAAGDRSYQCLLGVPDRRSIGDLLPADAIDGGHDDAGWSRP